MRRFERARRAAVRLQAAFRRWAGRRHYLLELAEFKEQAKLENQVKALQAKLEAKEREFAAREARGEAQGSPEVQAGPAEPPAEILEALNHLTAENQKLRGENERQRAEIEKLREENRHLRAERAAKDELLHSLRRPPKEAADGGREAAKHGTRASEPPRVRSKTQAVLGGGDFVEGEPPVGAQRSMALQLCPPLSSFWEDVPAEMIPLLKNGTEVHIKLGSHVLLLDEKDERRLTWCSWMGKARGYRRSMAFFVERRSRSDDMRPELGDDNSIGAAFALRSALTGRFVTLSSGPLHPHNLRVAGARPEEAAVFTCIPLMEGGSDELGLAAEYLCSVRLLGEKRFLRLRTDGHVAMASVSDTDAQIRHDKMAVAVEKLLPRASYEIIFDEDEVGITLSKDLPLRVCGVTSTAEPSCAERTGRVHVGDLLTSVNSQDIAHMPLEDVMPMIRCGKAVTLGFTVARDLSSFVGAVPTPREKEAAPREKRRGVLSMFGRNKAAKEGTVERSSGDVVDL